MSDTVLRPVAHTDEDFLFQLYCSTRETEMAAWGWPVEQQQLFLKFQYQAQQRQYNFPEVANEHQLIVLNEERIGRLITFVGDKEIRLVDISLLPTYRNKGIGSNLLKQLIEKSVLADKTLTLHVAKGNSAQHLYERLGFSTQEDDGVYLLMQYHK